VGKGEETRQAILDEAAAQASHVGLGGLTIGSLATQTRLSKSGLFAHFRSKEHLQLQVLVHTRHRFVDSVIRPALAVPRGEPRMRELFERWLAWDSRPGGCLFVAAQMELDDQPGPVRDELVSGQRDWMDTIAHVFSTGIREGHFRADADPEQFASDLNGVMLSFHSNSRLLADPKAAERARVAFERLLAAARPAGGR
jgi:AcrR family transcriptional regulator